MGENTIIERYQNYRTAKKNRSKLRQLRYFFFLTPSEENRIIEQQGTVHNRTFVPLNFRSIILALTVHHGTSTLHQSIWGFEGPSILIHLIHIPSIIVSASLWMRIIEDKASYHRSDGRGVLFYLLTANAYNVLVIRCCASLVRTGIQGIGVVVNLSSYTVP